jgi:hypothetical protein
MPTPYVSIYTLRLLPPNGSALTPQRHGLLPPHTHTPTNPTCTPLFHFGPFKPPSALCCPQAPAGGHLQPALPAGVHAGRLPAPSRHVGWRGSPPGGLRAHRFLRDVRHAHHLHPSGQVPGGGSQGAAVGEETRRGEGRGCKRRFALTRGQGGGQLGRHYRTRVRLGSG